MAVTMPVLTESAGFAALPEALKPQTQLLLERFEAACIAHGGDPRSLGARLGSLPQVWATSPFIAEYAIREPARFMALVGAEEIHETLTVAEYERRCTLVFTGLGDETAALRAIRLLRNQELVRIAWRDITGLAGVENVMQELSALADAIVKTSLRWLESQLAERYGYPRDEHGERQRLVVLAMGKLGGNELNFSSDIDLIFLYRGAGTTAGGRKQIDNQEYFDRLGKKLIAFLHEKTADGFVYRVDMRLRPFGDSGPLTIHFGALEHYYMVHGRDWERYALIKARAIGAEPRDLEVLDGIVRPFVYRRYLDFGALEAVREMKALINDEVARNALQDDVKRGSGGIREIEFIGQTLQMIRGGREVRLRQRAIIAILELCAELGLLARADVDALLLAYRFLRQTEHRLQQVHDQQTHKLPHSEAERIRLAFALGFANWPAYLRVLEQHRAAVRRCFSTLLQPAAGSEHASTQGTLDIDTLWTTQIAAEEAQRLLQAAGFADAPRALAVILDLKDPRFLHRLSREARARLDRLMPNLIAEVARHKASGETLARLGELLRGIARRSVYLTLLADNPSALSRLIDLYAASPWIAQQITRQPILLDELLDPRALFMPPQREDLELLLDSALQSTEAGDLDRVMDVLRNFRHQQVLRVAASDVMGRFPVAEVSNQLSYIAEVLLRRALTLAWGDLTVKHGVPTYELGEKTCAAGFGIIAYGKLGGLELGYSSDLDLVFVHDSAGARQVTNGARSISNDVFFTRLAQRIIHLITTRTAAGSAYEIDTRLRPSGKSGLLVTSLDAFNEYQHKEAWTWEHQALVRARSIAGDATVRERFETLRRGVLRMRRNPQQLGTEIREMRERMREELDRSDARSFDLKQGFGGITDIEFMVQYAVLRWAAAHPQLTTYTDNLRQLELIAAAGLLAQEDCRVLHDAFFAYRAEVHRCALQELDGLVAQSQFNEHRHAVQAIWHRLLKT